MAIDAQPAAKSYAAKFEKILKEKNAITKLLAKVEKKTGIKRLYIASGIISFLSLYLMIGYGGDFLCNFIGACYPAFKSIKAIESTRKDDANQWLMYWVVYSLISLLEFFSGFFFFFFWVPCYSFFKCIFLLWCMMPIANNGADLIYNRLINVIFLKYESKIDEAINTIGHKIDEAKKTVTNGAAELVSDNQKADKAE